MYWGAGRDCRYAGARRGRGGRHQGALGPPGYVGGVGRLFWGQQGV